ncbi:hypothetical protein M0R45_006141 [Rubus argutus]|uniref:threonine--tRNA ligase n=1 Tax=Rubus argutus TaxID=59490 RepID=A0AAW1YQ24_RUBAR
MEHQKPTSMAKDESYLDSVLAKRIKLFESIQAQQRADRQSLPSDPIKITLPDGKVKEGIKWITSPFDIASDISKSLASNALISEVNGVLWDMNRPLEANSRIKFFTLDEFDEEEEVRNTFWHSSAHILGQALELQLECELCICPFDSTRFNRKEGFYYDSFSQDLSLNDEHFKHMQAIVEKVVKFQLPFQRVEVSRQQALDIFYDNKFKVEIISALPGDKNITLYRCGSFVEMCPGPLIPNASFVKAFGCLKASSANWRSKRDCEGFQRVYGISYPHKERLQAHVQQLEEAKKYDHRVLGTKQELFFCHPLSPGSWFFLPKGTRIYKKLMDFIKYQHKKRGYDEVMSPNMFNMQLWEKSGHAEKYKENMFALEIEKQEFGLKSMNSPVHCLIFQHRLRSYRELPLRMVDFGVLHWNEAGSTLTELTSVRRLQQDDAHIFCRESQVKDEVRGVLDFIKDTYDTFGLPYNLMLSKMPENYIEDLAKWEKAETALKEALLMLDMPWKVKEMDGAGQGPKIHITVSDAFDREHQLATVHVDLQLPARFELYYIAEGEEGKREMPVIIGTTVLGSAERMFALLLEHYKGNWPFWLSPCQAIVCPDTNVSMPYALQVRDQIHQAGYYVDVDTSDGTIQEKLQRVELAQYNFIVFVDDRDKTRQVILKARDEDDFMAMNVDSLLQFFKKKSFPLVVK